MTSDLLYFLILRHDDPESFPSHHRSTQTSKAPLNAKYENAKKLTDCHQGKALCNHKEGRTTCTPRCRFRNYDTCKNYNCRLDVAGPDIERGCGSPLLADYTRSISSQVLHMQTISTVIGRWPVWSDMRGKLFLPTCFRGPAGEPSERNGARSGTICFGHPEVTASLQAQWNESSSGGYRAGQDRRQLMRRRIRLSGR